MPVDIKFLRSRGISAGQYKKLFTAKDRSKIDSRICTLVDTASARIKDWRTSNMRDWPIYHAIDTAHKAQFNQTTATMVRELARCDWSKMNEKEVQAKLAAYGISESDMFLRQEVKHGDTTREVLNLNVPVLTNVLVPLVVAYHAMRTAKLYVERDLSPLLSFTPVRQTDKNRTVCEIWTNIIDTISSWYGYPAYLKQAINQMLKYGIMLSFPMEEWHCEKQVIDGEVVVQKEGLRYVMPHPTRMGYDRFHPLTSFNTDTGCEWAFHWSVIPYSQILDNRLYWNKQRIPYPGDNWMNQPQAVNYFREVYPCAMKWPSASDVNDSREDRSTYYSTTNRDSALFLANYFCKIVPADWGLGDYKFPVWHRIIIAGDDTVIWCQPCAYNPVWFMGYDYDALAGMQSSFSLECLPWQDTLGNIFSQMLLTAKQNLLDVVYYDTNVISPADVEKQKNLGEDRYRSRIWIPFDSRKNQLAGVKIQDGIYSPNYQWRNIAELQGLVGSTITIMERILGVTAQEVGAAAAHYQSAKEVGETASSSSQRLASIGSGVDDGTDAWKRQLVDSAVYLNDDVVVQVSVDIPDYEKHLAAMGFKVVEVGTIKAIARGNKRNLPIEAFARSNTGPVTAADPAMAQVIFQTIGIAFQNPDIVAEIGVKRIIKLMQEGAKLAGAPDDFDIATSMAGAAEPPPAAIIQQLGPILQKLQETILNTVAEKVAMPAAELNAQQQQEIEALKADSAKYSTVFAKLESLVNKQTLDAQKVQQKMQIDQAEFAAEQQRKEEAHQADLRRTAEKTQAALTLQQAETAASIQTEQRAAAADIHLTTAETAAEIANRAKVTRADIANKSKVARAQAKAARAKPAAKKK